MTGSAAGADTLTRRLDVVAPQALPFQAVIVRSVLHNPTDRATVPAVGFESAFWLADLRNPEAAQFREIAGRTESGGVGYDPPYSKRQYRLHKHSGVAPFGPDEEGAVVTTWGECLCGERADPLFPIPGNYMARIKWHGNPLTQEIVIRIGTPQGDDAEAYRMLRSRRLVAAVICSADAVPNPAEMAMLTGITERFPKSSYADYARFALVRAAVNGWDRAKTGKFSEEKYQQALGWMNQVDLGQFPYAANLLSLMRQAASRYDPEKSAELATRLDRDFPEHRARLNDLAERLTQEQWEQLDPCRPHKHRAGK
jgi:hypothetical protein